MRTLDRCNPVVTALYFMSVTGISMFCMEPVLIFTSLIGSVLYFIVRNCGRSAGSHWFYLILFVVTALINPLVSHNGVTVLFVLNDSPITLESAVYGAVMAAMLIAVLYWFRSFTLIMTSDKLLYLFGRLSPKMALVLSMGLRYATLFSEQSKRIRQTQTALGLYSDDNVIDRIKGELRIFSVLVTWALENGIVTADSMVARGYGTGRRSDFSVFSFHRWDVIMLSLTLLLFSLTAVCIGSGAIGFEFYPYLHMHQLSCAAVTGYISYAVLVFLPVIIEAEENVKWNFLKSKI